MRSYFQFQHHLPGIRSLLKRMIFTWLILSGISAQSQNITGLSYWFDNESEGAAIPVNVTPAPDLTVDFSLPENISPGLHMLNIKAKDDGSHLSQINHYPFCYFRYEIPQITRLEYFIDNDPGMGLGTAVSFTPGANVTDIVFPLDLYNLPRGIHHLSIRGQDQNGSWSMTSDRVILCEPASQEIVAAEYFIDSDPGTGSGTPVSFVHGVDVSLVFELDLNSIPKGIHRLCIRAKDEFGRWSMTSDRVFLCEPMSQEIVAAEYFIDSDPGTGSGTPVSFVHGVDVSLVFELDPNSIPKGIHHFFLRVKDEYGRWSMTNDKVIICEPGTLPDIVQAEYFIDTDPGTGMGIDVPVTPAANIDDLVFMIDMSQLPAGIHNLFLRGKDSYGKWSLTNMAQFEVIALSHNLNLVVFLEGLYAGNAIMTQAYDENGPHFGEGIADQVTVELHSASNYADVVYTSGPVDLGTSGQVSITGIPAGISGSYYITVKHRNSIETTTAGPVSFSGTEISYDFSTSASQAYGDNLRDLAGVFVIWGGDVNQDGIVDGGDMNPVDNAATAITFGYVPEDVNGDGIVDGGDMNTVDNNSTAIIMALIP